MRVIAGKYRHRPLLYPDSNPNIRPTKDRIREALFSIIGPLDNKIFLDLYSGSGSIGIEAISRGAKKTYFVDYSPEAISYVKKNVNQLKIEEEYEIKHCKDFDALEMFKNDNVKFDVIYIDPPYELGEYEKLISYIYNNDLVNSTSIVILESNRKINTNELLDKLIKEYHYGEIILTVIRR